MQMPLVLPLFIQDRNFSSVLVLVNASGLSTYANVVVTGLDGREIKRERVNFSPHSQRRLEIYDLLQSAVSAATTGRITVVQSPDLKGMSIGAQLSMTYQASSDPNYIDEEAAMPSADGSQVLRGVADRAQGSPLIAISSLSEMSQQVLVECLGEQETTSSKSVQLLAGETVVVEACAERIVPGADFETILSTASAWPVHAAMDKDSKRSLYAVGIALRSDGMPGSFSAFGLSPHRKDGKQYFSAISFADPKMIQSSTTVFSGVPVGPATLLPEGTYVPELALANFSGKAVHVRVKYARTSESTPAAQDAENVTVPANASKWLVLNNLKGDPGLQNSFLVTSDAAPGDLMATLVSTSDSDLRQVELLGKDENDPNNGGGHPWSIQHGTDSTLLLFNPGEQRQKFTVAIQSGALLWQKVYQLSSMQTKAISIRAVIEDQIKDDQGKALPRDILSGEVGWFTPVNGKGRLLESNSEQALARNFSCPFYMALCGIEFDGQTTTMVIDDQNVAFGSATGQICQVYAGQCNGTFAYYGDNGFTYEWQFDTSGVFSVSGTSFDGTYSHATVNAVTDGAGGVGLTVGGWGGNGWYCQFYTDPQGFVQKPSSLQILSDTKVIDMSYEGGTCSNSSYGIALAIHYQVLDQRNPAQPVKSNAMEPQEEVTNLVINGQSQPDPAPNWTDIGPTTYPGTSRFTDANGQFWDAPLGVCADGPVTETAKQDMSVLKAGKRYPATGALRTNNWTMTSSSAGHGSITNGSDLTMSR